MRFIKILVVVLVFIGLIFFCVQNKEVLEQTLVFSFQIPYLMPAPVMSPETPMLFIFASALFIGAAVVWFYLLLGNIRSGAMARKYAGAVDKLSKENDAQTEEIDALKARLDELTLGPGYTAEPIEADDEEQKA